MERPDPPRFMEDGMNRWQEGDIDGFLDIFLTGISPNCTWRIAGHNPFGRELRGHDDVRSFFKQMFEQSKETYRATPVDWLISKENVAVFLRVTADTPGGPVDTNVVYFATVGADGKLDKNWFLPSDVPMHDRLLR